MLQSGLITECSAVRKRIYRIKKQVYAGFVENLDCYDDDTIFELETYEEEN